MEKMSSRHHSHSHRDYYSSLREKEARRKSTTRRVNFFDGVWAGFAFMFNFQGRMRRSEYWWFFLFSVLFSIVTYFGFLVWEDYMEQMMIERFQYAESWRLFPYLYTTYSLPCYILIAFIFSAQVKRFHDVGMKAWLPYAKTAVFALFAAYLWQITHAINSFDVSLGFIGWVLLLAYLALAVAVAVIACRDSEKGPNKYGKSPKYRRKIYEKLPPPPPAPKKSDLKKLQKK